MPTRNDETRAKARRIATALQHPSAMPIDVDVIADRIARTPVGPDTAAIALTRLIEGVVNDGCASVTTGVVDVLAAMPEIEASPRGVALVRAAVECINGLGAIGEVCAAIHNELPARSTKRAHDLETKLKRLADSITDAALGGDDDEDDGDEWKRDR